MMTKILTGGLAALLLAGGSATAAQTGGVELTKAAWGRAIQETNGTGEIRLEVREWPAGGRVVMPVLAPEIVGAHWLDGAERIAVFWGFEKDGAENYVELPPRLKARFQAGTPVTIVLETAAKTGQFAGGRFVLSATDAVVQGGHAKLEANEGNHRIGFWTDATDSVNWDYKPSRWGMYDVELAYSAEGGDGTELEVEVAGNKFNTARPPTGGWYRYGTLKLGRFYLPKEQPFHVRVGCKSLKGAAVMNLKALTLRPAPEGPLVIQKAGPVSLHASNAITHSITMRYEPLAHKNCLGFWVNPNDWAEWKFMVTRPGGFEVAVVLGCGKGSGGSDIMLEVGGQSLPFVVPDTGDYHQHVTNIVGRVNLNTGGNYLLAVRPQHKKSGPLMDIERVLLTPVGERVPMTPLTPARPRRQPDPNTRPGQ